jgi:hypothetical protein
MWASAGVGVKPLGVDSLEAYMCLFCRRQSGFMQLFFGLLSFPSVELGETV